MALIGVVRHLLRFTLFIFIISSILPVQVAAKTVPDSSRIQSLSEIKTDRNGDGTLDYLGQKVTTTGIANVGTTTLDKENKKVFIEDDSAGLLLFFPDTTHKSVNVAKGDSLVVTGKLELYYGKPEIVVENYRVVKEKSGLPPPVPLDLVYENPEQYMGMRTQGKAVVIDKKKEYGFKSLTIAPSDNSAQSLMVIVPRSHSHFKDFNFQILSAGDGINIRGIVDKYISQESGKITYEILPRTPADIKYTGIPNRYLTIAIGVISILFLVVIGWIITLRKKVKNKTQKISKALEEKEILLQEIHHRVKNNLSIISGLIGLQMDATEDEKAQEVLEDSQARIQSMAMIHDKLYQTDSLSSIRLDQYLKELVETIHLTFDGINDSIQIKFDMDPAEINIHKVVPCGLLVNELVVNAFKHAFEPGTEGVLEISLKKLNGKVELTIADNGPGLPDDFREEVGESLGSRLIPTFAQQLEAENEILEDRKGAAFKFRFSLQ